MYYKNNVPEIAQHLCKSLKLNVEHCSNESSDRLTCLVTEDWLKTLHKGQIPQHAPPNNIDACTVERLLSRSCHKIPPPWTKISIKAIAKSDQLYTGLPGGSMGMLWSCGSLYEYLCHISKENMNNLWLAAHSNWKMKSSHHGMKEDHETFTSIVQRIVRRLQPSVYINLQSTCDPSQVSDESQAPFPSKENVDSGGIPSTRSGSFYTTSETEYWYGFLQTWIAVETDCHFFLIQPYMAFTLHDVVSFSPTVLDSSHTKCLFIVYQLLQAMQTLHNVGLRIGNICLKDILVDQNLWLKVSVPHLRTLKIADDDLLSPTSASGSLYITASSVEVNYRKNTVPLLQTLHGYQPKGNTNERMFQAACEFLTCEQYKFYDVSMVGSLVSAWANREITNFQYLMILNHLSGRRLGDPNNHPVLPWVLDFTAPDSGFRDLAKSKFRLNKGDKQLDFTFSGMQELSESDEHVPHHVADILSDITYYVYKARQTPKSVLCAHVRSNWVPHEYPSSIQRLYLWTPDECIPEFFTDPTIFDSTHDDLPDLEIPPWSKNTLDFVVRHLAALESDHVSSSLHHWIDLTFGYMLSGSAAVAAKNVHLQLVDQHTHLMPTGAVQIFQHPHPQRHTQQTALFHAVPPHITRGTLNSQLMTYGFTELDVESQTTDSVDGSEQDKINQAAIHLPRSYNPLSELEQCESLLDFNAKALHLASPSQTGFLWERMENVCRHEAMVEDMATFLCLVCEMSLNPKLRIQDSRPPLCDRLTVLKQICKAGFDEIQRPLQKFVADMFASLEVRPDKRLTFSTIFCDGSPPPTPNFLLQSYSDLIPFPPYFSELYACLNNIQEKSAMVEQSSWSGLPLMERVNRIKQLEREKIPILESFLWHHQGYLGPEGMGLLLPFIQDLLENQYTTVQAAWSLFNVTARELGPQESSRKFLSHLTALYSGEVTTAKHIKLYHRTFLMQLIIRLGLKTFLQHFSTRLVEAVAGYKDFCISSKFYPEELLEEFSQDDILKPAGVNSTQMTWSEDAFVSSTSNAGFNRDTLDGQEVDDGHDSSCGDMEETIVDCMSLDGDHVPLECDDLDDENVTIRSRLQDTDSLGSTSSDERASRYDKEAMALGESYGSVDRVSIHSISNLMPRNGSQGSPDHLLDAQSSRESDEMECSPFWDRKDPQCVDEGEGQNVPQIGGRTRQPDACTLSDSLEGTMSEIGTRLSESPLSPRVIIPSSRAQPIAPRSSSRVFLPGRGRNGETQLDRNLSESPSGWPETDASKQAPNRSSSSTPFGRSGSRNLEEGSDDSVDQADLDSSKSRGDSKSDMVRSETEDLMMNLSLDQSGASINIRDIAADSVKWLCHKLGPVLGTKFLSRNLVRMLALCYLGEEQLAFLEATDNSIAKTSRLVVGDKNAQKILECIGFSILLYGEQVALIQCLPNIMDMIRMAHKRLTPRSENGLIASVVLLTHLLPYLSDRSLMNVLEETIINNCLTPVISLLVSEITSFPSGSLSRSVLCHKTVDLFYSLGLRLGFEMTRKYLNKSMLHLFDMFSNVHGRSHSVTMETVTEDTSASVAASSVGSDDAFINIKMDAKTHQYMIGSPVNLRTLKSPVQRRLSNFHSLTSAGVLDDREDFFETSKPGTLCAEKCTQEIKAVFSPEMAQALYIPLCRIFGSIHMEENLHNDDLIRQLCAQHDSAMDLIGSKPSEQSEHKANKVSHRLSSDAQKSPESSSPHAGIGSNVAVIGNRIQLNESPATSPLQQEITQFGRGYQHSGILSIHLDEIRSPEMEQNKHRHLRGNWLAYWERELGHDERDTMFNFMQIELQTFTGHTGSIRSIQAMDTENCFVSASKDKTVRLWSIDGYGDSINKQACQFTYLRHKKSVFSVAYVDSMRLVASCDGTVHVWDPYTGVALSQLESPKHAPVVALTALAAPSALVAMATESSIRFLDMRTSKYAHSFKCSIGNIGLIKSLVVSPDSSWLAVGFATGIILIMDLASGTLLHCWRAHEGEILQLKACSKSRLLSSSMDQTVKHWNVDSATEVSPAKSQQEPVHCLSLYRDQLISASIANRICVYSSLMSASAYSSSKLKSGTFKGVLTHMTVLPLNKSLLLGADNGIIRLMA